MKFDFGKANSRKLLLLPLWGAGYLLSHLVPRDRSQWVFGRHGVFGDNARYLMEYVHHNHPEITCVWLAHTREERAAVRECGLPVKMANGPAGWYCTLRAGVGIICLGLGDLNRLAIGGLRIVQLWHGSPLKRIGLDAQVNFEVGTRFGGRWAATIIRKAYAATSSGYDLVTAPSETVRKRYVSAFGVGPEKVVVTGDPKADIIQSADSADQGAIWRRKMRDRYGIAPSGRIVLYAPTWRENANVDFYPPPYEAQELEHLLREADAWLLVRAHRFDGDTGGSDATGSRIRTMSSRDFPDVNYLLPGIDAVVSDYSGIIMDFSLLRRPILFFAPDLGSYSRSRGLYEPYDDFTGGNWASNWPQLIADLRRCLTANDTPYCENADHIAKKYTVFADTGSCRRIALEIKKRFAV